MSTTNRTPPTLADRLWPRLDRERADGCWTWTGPLPEWHDRFPRYAQVSVPPAERHLFGGRKQVGIHRAAWTLTHGPVPEGLFVCHRCDVTICANPSHLWLGTGSENVRDAVAKGRAYPTRVMLAEMPKRLARVERVVEFLAARETPATSADLCIVLGLTTTRYADSREFAPLRELLKRDARVLVRRHPQTRRNIYSLAHP